MRISSEKKDPVIGAIKEFNRQDKLDSKAKEKSD